MVQNQWNAWTPEQDQRLRTIFEAGSSAVLVAAKFKRTVLAIRGRARVLGISTKRKKARPGEGQLKARLVKSGPRWTPEEDERLRKLASEGRGSATIAERLKRSPNAIRNRSARLKIQLVKEKGK